jgi:hypothetical protein
MSGLKRKILTSAFEAKVALEAIRGAKTLNEIGQEFWGHFSASALLLRPQSSGPMR